MENNNGRGIFYGVIGVATLVVAIIGATFAYFSAQVTANQNIAAGTASIELTMTEDINGVKNNIIPIDTDDGTGETPAVDNLAVFPTYVDNTADGCLDDLDNEICSVYKFTIENNNPVAQTVQGYINVNPDTDYGDVLPSLHYAIFVGDAHDSYEVHGTEAVASGNITCVAGTDAAMTECTGSELLEKATAVSTLPDGGASQNYTVADDWHPIKGSSIQLEAYSKVSYTVVMWLEETYLPQDEQGKEFFANIHFDTGSGTGVTGQIGG